MIGAEEKAPNSPPTQPQDPESQSSVGGSHRAHDHPNDGKDEKVQDPDLVCKHSLRH